jgi:signal transduction histidine kinase
MRKKSRGSLQYTRTRTYRFLLIIVFCLAIGIAGVGFQVLNRNEDFPVLTGAVTLLLIFIILMAVLALFNNLKDEETYLESKEVFLSVASHDIQSPLIGINWAVENMAKQEKDPDQKTRLNAIQQSSKAVLQTVDDALSITSLEYLARQKVDAQDVDLIELMEEVMNGYKLTALQKNVILKRIGNWPNRYIVKVDPKQFRRVLANIIADEIKFTASGTEVSFTFTEGQNKWTVSFHNDGQTIPKEDQKRIFELYRRTKESNKAGIQGIGFGLYLAQQIVHKHGGDLSVRPDVSNGVTFDLVIPKSIAKNS